MRRLLLTSLFSLMLLSVAPMWAQQGGLGKLSPWLRQLARQEASLSNRVAPSDGAMDSRQVCALADVTTSEVLPLYGSRSLAEVGGVHIVSIPIAQLRSLAADQRVRRIEARPLGTALNDSMAIHLNALPVYAGTNLPQPYTGKDVVVGIMDIGFDLTHPNFLSRDTTQYRIKRLWDMLSTDTVGSPFYVGRDYTSREALLDLQHSRDGLDMTHGTYTLGIAAGSGYTSNYRGMAPESDICLVSNAVSDNIAYIDSADYYKYTYATDALGFKYIFDYATSVNKPCVISLSEGSTQDFWGYDQLYYAMLDSLVGPGRILVAAAGNNAAYKSWFRKPFGDESMGSFLISDRSDMLLTFKSAQDFSLRFVLYADTNDTLMIRTSDVLMQKDSVLTSLLRFDDFALAVKTEAYPSCYDAREMCYDVKVSTTYNIGSQRNLSVEVLGQDADVEFFRVNGQLCSNDLNPALNAGENVCCIHSPSSAPCVISVGATSYRDGIQNLNGEWKSYWLGQGGVRAPFSSVGPTFDGRVKPDVMAPGNNIISSFSSYYMEAHPDASDLTWDVGRYDFNGRPYAWISSSGTSASSPAVAGAIALWLQAKPDLTPEEVKDVLSHTCRHYDEGLTYPNNEYGYGEIDVYRGLLYILGVDKVEAVSSHHTAARVSCVNHELRVLFDQPQSSPVRLRLYTINGRLVQTAVINAGQTSFTHSLSSLPAGIYAVQLDGPAAVQGSTLIRR